MSDVEIKFDKLKGLIRAFSGQAPEITIGIDDPSQAEIGIYHEFGTTNMPVRSFLRMPLLEVFPKALSENSEQFDDSVLDEVAEQESLLPWAQIIGEIGLQTVLGAFISGGYGKWQNLKPSTWARKTNAYILVETGKLMNSIKMEIK